MPISGSRFLTLLLLSLATSVQASNFTQCLINFANSTSLTGGVDENGNSVPASSALGLTYETCTAYCGSGAEAFDWSFFSQGFGAWLLPWLALISTLPFGAKRTRDSLAAVVLAVGSPTLAAFSLILTVLNGSWLSDRMAGLSYPNADLASRILNNLQQTPFTIGPPEEEVFLRGDTEALDSNETLLLSDTRFDKSALLSSLIVLPLNDAWWRDFDDRLNYVRTWGIAAVISITWVVIAYLFSVLDALTSSPDGNLVFNISTGQAMSASWLWLLAIVIGWLWIAPKCDYSRIRSAFVHASELAYVASESGEQVPSRKVSDYNALMLRTEYEHGVGMANTDELRTCPIFNYSRFFSWNQHAEEIINAFVHATYNTRSHKPVDDSSSWEDADNRAGLHPANRIGTLEQVKLYCSGIPDKRVRVSHSKSNVLSRLVVASCMSLTVQWATTGSAIVILWFTPSVGLGCRSATYLLYASLSSLVWMLLFSSSILFHLADSRRSKRHLRRLAVFVRRSGKTLAAVNALVIFLGCILQLANQYDSCLCNAQLISVLKHMWNQAYDVFIDLPQDISRFKVPGLVLGWGGVILYLLVVFMFGNQGI